MCSWQQLRASKAAAGAARSSKNRPQEPADHALGRSRGGFGTKLHLVCCGNGVPIGVTVTAGQAHESRHFEDAIATVRPKSRKPIWIAGDKGYCYPRIHRGVFRSVHSLERAIPDYIDTRNENAKPFAWTADADNILRRVKNVCGDTSDSGQ
jgi:hypothetical protein